MSPTESPGVSVNVCVIEIVPFAAMLEIVPPGKPAFAEAVAEPPAKGAFNAKPGPSSWSVLVPSFAALNTNPLPMLATVAAPLPFASVTVTPIEPPIVDTGTTGGVIGSVTVSE